MSGSKAKRHETTIPLARSKTRGLFFSALFFSVFTNLLMLTGPLFMLQVYDRVLGSRSEETLVALFALVAMLYFFYWLLEYARGRVMARVGTRIQSVLNTPIFFAVVERAARGRAPKAGTLSDIEAVKGFLGAPVMLALFDMPWTPVFLIAIFIFHPLLGWLAVAGGSLLITATVLNQLLTRARAAKGAELQHAAARFAAQTEAAGPFVRAQGLGPQMAARWSALAEAASDQTLAASDWTGSFTAFTKAFRLFLQSAMLAVGAWLVLQNQMTAGAMIAASILMGRALAPIEAALSGWPMAQRARTGWRDLGQLLSALPANNAKTELPAPEARLNVSGVTFVLNRGDRPILNQVSFDVAPGEALGIIGKSGSGKTTLARVLVGLVTPLSGEVRLAGATLDQYGPEYLGKYIGYLPQDVQFFDGTIAENIAQMSTTPDSAKVVEAAQKARVHDIILSLPKGYDTLISGADAQLSGGQKQRLALARALYNDPVLLVLDEPNSALDSEGSEALNTVVAAMKAKNRGVLIMTHRPTAISACDKLLVLDGGRPAGFGPRDEIIKALMKNAADVQRAVAGSGT